MTLMNPRGIAGAVGGWAVRAWQTRLGTRTAPRPEAAPVEDTFGEATHPEAALPIRLKGTEARGVSGAPALFAAVPEVSWRLRGLPISLLDSMTHVPALATATMQKLPADEARDARRRIVEGMLAEMHPPIAVDWGDTEPALRQVLEGPPYLQRDLVVRLLAPRSTFDAFIDPASNVVRLVEAQGEWPPGVARPDPARALELLADSLRAGDSPLPDALLEAAARTLPIDWFELLAQAGWLIGGPRGDDAPRLHAAFGPLSATFEAAFQNSGVFLGGADEFLREIRLNTPELDLNRALNLLTHEMAHVVSILLSLSGEPRWFGYFETAYESDPAAVDAAKNLLIHRTRLEGGDVEQWQRTLATSLSVLPARGTGFLTQLSTLNPEEHLVESLTLLFQTAPRWELYGLTPGFATRVNLKDEATDVYAYVLDVCARRVSDALKDPQVVARQRSTVEVVEGQVRSFEAGADDTGEAHIWRALLACARKDPELLEAAFSGMRRILEGGRTPEALKPRMRAQLDTQLAAVRAWMASTQVR